MKKYKWIKIILSWALVVLWMMIIYDFSADNATTSSGLSTRVIEYIHQWIPFVENTHLMQLIVRKSAHMAEYAILGSLVLQAAFHTFKKPVNITLLFCLASASFDECHQLFVDGRAGRVSDVCIDMMGVVIILLVIKWIERLRHGH